MNQPDNRGSLNSNELLRYLQGFVETQTEPLPTKDQWATIRARVLEGYPVNTFVLNTPPPEFPDKAHKPCGCK